MSLTPTLTTAAYEPMLPPLQPHQRSAHRRPTTAQHLSARQRLDLLTLALLDSLTPQQTRRVLLSL